MLARLELEPKRPQFAYASWPLPLLNYRAKRREAHATASANPGGPNYRAKHREALATASANPGGSTAAVSMIMSEHPPPRL